MSFAVRMIGATVGGGGGSGVFLTRFDAICGRVSGVGSATVTITANTDGTLVVTGNGNVPTAEGNVTPDPGYYSPTTAAIGNNYQIRITPTAGSFSTGTVNSWLALSSTRTWTVSANNALPAKQTTFTVEVRDTTAGTVLATTTLNYIDCEFTQI